MKKQERVTQMKYLVTTLIMPIIQHNLQVTTLIFFQLVANIGDIDHHQSLFSSKHYCG